MAHQLDSVRPGKLRSGITRMDTLYRLVVVVFRVSVLSYVVVRLSYYVGRQWGYENGDEDVFREDLELIQQQGWTEAIEDGISVPYMILARPLSLVLDPISSLRLTNVAVFCVFLAYFWKVRRIKDLDFFILMLFFFSTFGYFLSAVNDTLFTAAFGIFLVETHFIANGRKPASLTLWGTGLVLAVFTRALFVVFLPTIVLAAIFVFRAGRPLLKTLAFPALLAVALLAVNTPSLRSSGVLSYEQKLPPERVEVTWTQRQYLAQLMVNAGELEDRTRPSWDETQDYVDVNGLDSLPASIGESMTHDVSFTLTEFVKDLRFTLVAGTRKLGLILVVLGALLARRLLRDRRLEPVDFVPLVVFGTIITFSMIMVSFVELRWFGPVFFAAILNYYERGRSGEIPYWLVVANYGLIAILSWRGIHTLINQSFG